MPKLTQDVNLTTLAGEKLDLTPRVTTGSVSNAYAPVMGWFLAHVATLGFKEYAGTYKGEPTKYWSITPTFHLFNDNKTRIERQRFIIGTVNDAGALYHPENSNPVWGGELGALGLINAIGGFTQDDNGKQALSLDTDATDFVVKVIVRPIAYIKGNPSAEKNFDALMVALKDYDITPKSQIADIVNTVALYNQDNNTEYRVGNRITGIFALNDEDFAELTTKHVPTAVREGAVTWLNELAKVGNLNATDDVAW